MSRLAADLVRAEQRITDLETERDLLRSILAKLKARGHLRLRRPFNLGLPWRLVSRPWRPTRTDITDTEAQVFRAITEEASP